MLQHPSQGAANARGSLPAFVGCAPAVFVTRRLPARKPVESRERRRDCCMQHRLPNAEDGTRRALLRGVLAAAALPLVRTLSGATAPALAYSSPYSQSPAADKQLPERLYDSSKIVKTPSGLAYFDLLVGDTAKPAVTKGNVIACSYTTRLGGLYGIKLDSSSDRNEEFRFTVGDGNVIQGLNEMVIGMHPGGKRRAVMPPSIAYTNPDMLPAVKDFFARRRLLSVLNTNRDATIVMDIELLRIK